MNDFDEALLRESGHSKKPPRPNRNPQITSVNLTRTFESAQYFTRSLAEFRRTGAFCDLEIVCESAGTVNCHRIVAAAASPVLKSALKTVEDEFNDDGTARINLPDFSVSAVEAYVNAVYDALSGVRSTLDFQDASKEVRELALFLTKKVPYQNRRETQVSSLVSNSTAARCHSCRTSLNPYPESTANLTVIDLQEKVSPPAAKVPKLEHGADALVPAKRDGRREQKLKLHRGEKVPVEEMRRMVENCSGSFFPVRTNKNAFEPGKKKDRYCMKNENDFLVLCGVARCSKKKVLLARDATQQR